MNYAAQLMGIFAIIIWIFSIQKKNKKDILLIQIIANIFYGIQYVLLNAYTAGLICFISAIRCYVFRMEDNSKKSKFSLVFFITMTIWSGLITFDGIYTLIPIIIYSLYTYSSWIDDLKKFRLIYTLCAFVWLFFNFRVGAYVSCFGNIGEIISGAIALFKYDLRRKNG